MQLGTLGPKHHSHRPDCVTIQWNSARHHEKMGSNYIKKCDVVSIVELTREGIYLLVRWNATFFCYQRLFAKCHREKADLKIPKVAKVA